ncbi:MAG: NAD(+)/NADH kinase [Kofleriaceae bacterium]
MRVGFILKPDKSNDGVLLGDLARWLLKEGHTPVVTTEDHVGTAGVEIVPEDSLGEACDLAVVLGGDGTMLRASRLVADHHRPVLGINLGQLGFLTGFAPEEAQAALRDAIDGKLQISKRMRLSVRFVRANGDAVSLSALNDTVIHQGAMARLVELIAAVDDDHVAAYRSDGLIVATPTGSTAYNMAAGGPILFPGQTAMTLTPICTHSLTHRPLVVPATSTIRITLSAEIRGVVLTVDGQWAHSFLRGDVVEMTAAPIPLLLYASKQTFFDVMRDKLHWGLRSDQPR